jgi:hypothetical protein
MICIICCSLLAPIVRQDAFCKIYPATSVKHSSELSGKAEFSDNTGYPVINQEGQCIAVKSSQYEGWKHEQEEWILCTAVDSRH